MPNHRSLSPILGFDVSFRNFAKKGCLLSQFHFTFCHFFVGHVTQPCQNVPAACNFATVSQFLAAYSTLNFTRSPLAGKGTWCLLPATPSMLPTAAKHFDRAGHLSEYIPGRVSIVHLQNCLCSPVKFHPVRYYLLATEFSCSWLF